MTRHVLVLRRHQEVILCYSLWPYIRQATDQNNVFV
jgi:hypothetical protein